MGLYIRNSRRTISIDVLCFLFSLVIVLNHLKGLSSVIGGPTIFNNGYFPVGFFFITSGYLMTKSAMQKETDISIGIQTWQFIFSKLKSIWFFIFTGWCCALPLVFKSDYFTSLVDVLLIFFEPLMLQSTGVGGIFVNSPAWYLSAMFFAMLISFPLCKKYKENYYCLIAPILSFILIGTISNTTGGLQGGSWYGFPLLGDDFLRGLLGISLGATSYALEKHVFSTFNTHNKRVLLTVLEITGYFVGLFIFSSKWGTNLDFISWITFTFCVASSFSEKSYLSVFFDLFSKFAPFARKLSTVIFLNHWWLVKLASLLCKRIPLFSISPVLTYIFFLLVCIIWAIFLIFLERWFIKFKNRRSMA